MVCIYLVYIRNTYNGFHHFVAFKLEDLARLKISLQAPIFIPSGRPTHARSRSQAHASLPSLPAMLTREHRPSVCDVRPIRSS